MATIERVEIRMVDLKPKVKRVDAIQSFVSQETPIVRITDSDGAVGTGYSYTIGTGGPSIVELLARSLAPALIGRDAAQVEEIWRDLLFLTHATSVGAITALALAAIDTALWDLRCRKARPAAACDGGRRARTGCRSTPPRAAGCISTAGAGRGCAASAKAHGFGGSKIKIGRPDPRGRRAAGGACATALGADFEIMTDANQAFARRRGDPPRPALRAARPRLVRGAAAGRRYRRPRPALARRPRIPIAVGESLYSLPHFREYLQRGACSIVQVDVARIGGITPWLKIAHLAEAFNMAVCPHFLMELHVALCCAVPNARWVEYIPQLDDLTTEPMRIATARAVPSPAPGLGIAWDFEAIERMTAEGSRHDLRLA